MLHDYRQTSTNDSHKALQARRDAGTDLSRPANTDSVMLQFRLRACRLQGCMYKPQHESRTAALCRAAVCRRPPAGPLQPPRRPQRQGPPLPAQQALRLRPAQPAPHGWLRLAEARQYPSQHLLPLELVVLQLGTALEASRPCLKGPLLESLLQAAQSDPGRQRHLQSRRAQPHSALVWNRAQRHGRQDPRSAGARPCTRR